MGRRIGSNRHIHRQIIAHAYPVFIHVRGIGTRALQGLWGYAAAHRQTHSRAKPSHALDVSTLVRPPFALPHILCASGRREPMDQECRGGLVFGNLRRLMHMD